MITQPALTYKQLTLVSVTKAFKGMEKYVLVCFIQQLTFLSRKLIRYLLRHASRFLVFRVKDTGRFFIENWLPVKLSEIVFDSVNKNLNGPKV